MSLGRSLFNYDKTIQKTDILIPGEIGTVLNGRRITEVPNRGQFVYVRLRSNQSEVIQAFNDKVFPGYGIPVLVKWNNTRYEVVARDTQRYPEWEAENPQIAKHGATHSLDKENDRVGTDPVWVYPYQFMPSLVSPFPTNGVQNVYIHPHTILENGQWRYIGNTGTSSFAPYRPHSGSVLVLVTIDNQSGNPSLFATTGSYIPNSITGTSQFVPYLPEVDKTRYLPLSYIQLQSGTSSITWDNIYDVRQFLSTDVALNWDDLTNVPIETLEDLSNQIDGITQHFTLSHTAIEKVEVYCNILQPKSSYAMDDDYNGFTLSFAPSICDTLLVRYKYQ